MPSIDVLDVVSELWKARMRLALYAVYEAENTNNVKLGLLPSRGVITSTAAKVRAVKLVPLTTVVLISKDSDMANHAAAPSVREAFKHKGTSYACVFGLPKIVLEHPKVTVEGTAASKVSQTELYCPAYWLVSHTYDQAKANMEKVMVKATLPGSNVKINVPCIQNLKALEERAELFMYKAKVEVPDVAVEMKPIEGGKSKGAKRGGAVAEKGTAKVAKR